MKFSISKSSGNARVLVIDDVSALNALDFTAAEREYIVGILDDETAKDPVIPINHYVHHTFIVPVRSPNNHSKTSEALRKAGAQIQSMAERHKIKSLAIQSSSGFADAAALVALGISLAGYQFLKYRSDAEKKRHHLTTISFSKESITKDGLRRLQATVDAIYLARNLVNEPVNTLTATQLAKQISEAAEEAGVKHTVLHKDEIEKEKMGGILAVNLGSVEPPTFTILEYKPAKAKNKRPIVLVGKGIVYDTGGLSLKPTPNSMDRMKSDMSGAAVVSASICAAAQMELPLHIIALVPATDNRPGGNAYTPGDVITQYDGTTVEVLNTDAEGRLVLADALSWARRYKPELVLDFATLTGAASVAVGEHGIVCMGTADEAVQTTIQESGERQYERLVTYPLWEEYGDQLKSDIADLKNVGGPTGGAITAGKFLEHFTDYPWMHFDIAGVSFATTKKHYRTVGGTGYGIRMLLDFLAYYKSEKT